ERARGGGQRPSGVQGRRLWFGRGLRIAEGPRPRAICLVDELDRLGRHDELCRLEHPAGQALRHARLYQSRLERSARRLRRVPSLRHVTFFSTPWFFSLEGPPKNHAGGALYSDPKNR